MPSKATPSAKPSDQLCNYCNAECERRGDIVYCTDSDCKGSLLKQWRTSYTIKDGEHEYAGYTDIQATKKPTEKAAILAIIWDFACDTSMKERTRMYTQSQKDGYLQLTGGDYRIIDSIQPCEEVKPDVTAELLDALEDVMNYADNEAQSLSAALKRDPSDELEEEEKAAWAAVNKAYALIDRMRA